MALQRKTRAEKRQTRKAQMMRYRARKQEQGLALVSVWIPKKVADAFKGMRKMGVVFADGYKGDEKICLRCSEKKELTIVGV